MNPLSPEKILRSLDNNFVMTRQDQAEAAHYIRDLQRSNEALKEGLIKFAEDIFELRRQLKVWKGGVL